MTVAGIAIISVLCDVILPEGQTRKYVKTVFGVVVSLVIIQPLIGLFTGNGFSWATSASQDMTVQEQYIESASNRQNQNTARSMKLTLEANDIAVDDINVSEASKTLTVQLGVQWTAKTEAKVQEIAKMYFPNYKLVIFWT